MSLPTILGNLFEYLVFMITSVAGAVLGVLIANLLWLWIRKPRLKIMPTWKHKGEPDVAKHFRSPMAIYRITVKNTTSKSDPARNVRLRLTWFKDNTQVLQLPGKWDFRPEPLRYERGDMWWSLR